MHAPHSALHRSAPEAATGVARPQQALVAVLAGGESRRMGQPKASVRLHGQPLICYPLAAARKAGLKSIVVAKHGSELPSLFVQTVVEPDAPRHPLCGILAALRHARRPVIAVGCDMPFVSAALLLRLTAAATCTLSARATVASVGGRMQPLPGLYLPSDLPAMERALTARSSLRETLAQLAPRVLEENTLRKLGEPERLCFSVNDVDDLRTASHWMAG